MSADLKGRERGVEKGVWREGCERAESKRCRGWKMEVVLACYQFNTISWNCKQIVLPTDYSALSITVVLPIRNIMTLCPFQWTMVRIEQQQQCVICHYILYTCTCRCYKVIQQSNRSVTCIPPSYYNTPAMISSAYYTYIHCHIFKLTAKMINYWCKQFITTLAYFPINNNEL